MGRGGPLDGPGGDDGARLGGAGAFVGSTAGLCCARRALLLPGPGILLRGLAVRAHCGRNRRESCRIRSLAACSGVPATWVPELRCGFVDDGVRVREGRGVVWRTVSEMPLRSELKGMAPDVLCLVMREICDNGHQPWSDWHKLSSCVAEARDQALIQQRACTCILCEDRGLDNATGRGARISRQSGIVTEFFELWNHLGKVSL